MWRRHASQSHPSMYVMHCYIVPVADGQHISLNWQIASRGSNIVLASGGMSIEHSKTGSTTSTLSLSVAMYAPW